MLNANTIATVKAEIEALRAAGETDIVVTLSNRNCTTGTYQAQWGDIGALSRTEAEAADLDTDDMMSDDEFEAYVS